MKTPFLIAAWILALAAPSALRSQESGLALERSFVAPPQEAKPWIYWYWMNACSSKEGITADLAAMKSEGIGGAHLVPIRGAATPSLVQPPVEQFTPVWWEHVRYAVAEAKRLGLKIGFHSSDGYATAGGPWITPELSMQHVVWTETFLAGGHPVDLALAEPRVQEGYYRDIEAIAYPVGPEQGRDSRSEKPVVTSSTAAGNLDFLRDRTGQVFTSEKAGWIQYEFVRPFTCRSLVVELPHNKGIQYYTYPSNCLTLEVSDDGIGFRRVATLEPPRHGWQDGDEDVTHSIPEVSARYYRMVYDPQRKVPGSEDMDSAKWNAPLKLEGLLLSSEPRIHQFEGKSGAVWRISRLTLPAEVPDSLAIPLDKCIDVSGKMDATGRLRWNLPAGRWAVLRLGTTSTGAHNDTGGTQLGLECDKLSEAAARLMFERWFGEITRQLGPELTASTVKTFHVDSWECGSQNWSPSLVAGFKAHRGYDPLPYLPALAGVPVGGRDVAERFLRDWRETIADLVTENFFGTLHREAAAKGCRFSAECVAPVMVSDDLAFYRNVDIPMGEFWLRSPTNDKLNDILDGVSGARIYGKRLAQAEAFTELQLQWDEYPAMLKTLGDRNYAFGINRFIYHVYAHNPWPDRKPGMTLSGVGTFFSGNQTWWKPARAFVDYDRRCQAILQEGRAVCDIAVFSGDSVPRRAFVPWNLSSTLPQLAVPEAGEAADRIRDPAHWVDPLGGYAYDSISRDALIGLSTVEHGRLELPGGASYSIIIVPAKNPMTPDPSRLTPEVLQKLSEAARGGATILLGERPGLSPSLSGGGDADALAAKLTDKLWPAGEPADGFFHPFGQGGVIRGPLRANSFEKSGVERDFAAMDSSGERARGVAWTHRSGPGWDAYFISNQQPEARTLDLSFRQSGRIPELWNPVETERKIATQWAQVNGRTRLTLNLPSSGSVFVVFRKKALVAAVNDGINSPNLTLAKVLDRPWNLQFDPAPGENATVRRLDQLVSWTDIPVDAIRHYSGTASYCSQFDWAPMPKRARVWVDLGTVHEIAEVYVNGIDCGVAWTPPYRVEVSGALRNGPNTIKIEVSNTWFNRLSGDRETDPQHRVTFTTAPLPAAGRPLMKSGLLGPVRLLILPR